MRPHLKRTLVCLVASLLTVHAHPKHFYNPAEGYVHPAPACTAHPARSYLAEGSIHGVPQIDSRISFTLSGSDGVAATVCPGSSYTISVNFTDVRLAMLTSGQAVAFTRPAGGCPNRADLGGSRTIGAQTGFVVPFKVACTASGQLMFRVTSAAVEPPNAWKQNSVTFAVSAACAAPACATTPTAPPSPPSPPDAPEDHDHDHDHHDHEHAHAHPPMRRPPPRRAPPHRLWVMRGSQRGRH
ncbi:hypothetical protein CHLRE_03g204129v5 [Chlamydomonas reinhardtii]|uniref:Pherophorin domain-containing protein n=1 Tax=Chlamydomonas reinhardtii TaxID=3055 RepID=A0A2K3DZP4_CHLRE|nr:uncharacterized protein CHLRE_03g204129v5 [Chlamydomonas reinhardtii]PNW86003.1 hypothetical protein CHLRE_03g204129v5 [Chlamydomonas reinhardtii]